MNEETKRKLFIVVVLGSIAFIPSMILIHRLANTLPDFPLEEQIAKCEACHDKKGTYGTCFVCWPYHSSFTNKAYAVNPWEDCREEITKGVR